MVDLHAHILPGIDDGPASIEESIQMSRLAFQDGIRTIVATPHIGKFPNTREIISEKVNQLKERLRLENINIELLFGSDLEFSAEIFSFIGNKSVVTINNSRYLLLDIPHSLMPPNVERHIERMLELGIVPIIAHPERCIQIQEDLNILYSLVKAGAILQITASSILGKIGSKAEEVARNILKRGLAHVIATDTHGLNKRRPLLREAVEIASGIVGRDAVLAMVTTTPRDIIDNKPLTLPKPSCP